MHKSLKQKSRRVLLSMLLGIVLGSFLVGSLALAQLQTGLEYGTATGLGTQDIRESIMKIIRAVLGFLGVLALVIIVYGGWVWMTAAGNTDRVALAKRILINAIIGLVIILSSFMITSFIITQLSDATGSGPGGSCSPGEINGCFECDVGGSFSIFHPEFSGCGDPPEFCSVVNITPSGTGLPMNSVARVRFTQDNIIDPSDSIQVYNITDGSPGILVPTIRTFSGNLVELFPDAIPCPVGGGRCFPADSDFEIRSDDPAIECGGFNLICGSISGNNCIETFSTGNAVDVDPPTITIIGTQICEGPINTIDALVDDDFGIAFVDFFEDGVLLNTDNFISVPPAEIARVAWDTSSFVEDDVVLIDATAVDYDNNITIATQLEVTFSGALCCNAIQDGDETGVDCGGTSCEVCSPVIEWVSPNDGAPGNLITIHGRRFETDPGDVIFLGSGVLGGVLGVDPADLNPACSGYWTDEEIIIGVPVGAEDGPIEIVRPDLESDRTDQAPGTNIANFDQNDIVRPGLCEVDPVIGPPSQLITLEGINLFNPLDVLFGALISGGTPNADPLSRTITGATVPTLANGDVMIRSHDDPPDGEYSNPISFEVSSDPPPNACFDSDGSPTDVYTKGTVTANVGWTNYVIEDTCSSPTEVFEQGCDPDNPTTRVSEIIACSTGDVCTLGVCGPTPPPPSCDGDPLTLVCDPDPTLCPAGYECNTSSCFCETTIASGDDSAYTWFFTTTSLGPRVAETCNRSFSCDIGSIASPTPFNRTGTNLSGAIVGFRRDDGEVPIDATIGANFTAEMQQSSLSGATIRVVACNTGSLFDRDSCLTTISGTWGDPITTASSFQYIPTDILDVNTWHQVILNASQIFGINGVALAPNDASGDYIWIFKTRDDTTPGEVGCVYVDPASQTSFQINDLKNWTSQAADQDFVCVILNPNLACSLGWSWSTGGPEASIEPPDPLDPPHVATTRSLAETVPGPPVNVLAQCNNPTGNLVGIGELTINFSSPVVIGSFPNCGTACLNSKIGATFSLPMNELSVRNAMSLHICFDDPDCEDPVTEISFFTFTPNDPAEEPNSFTATVAPGDIDGDGVDDFWLLPNNYYRVVVDNTAVSDLEGKSLENLNYSTTVGGPKDAYSWVFKTQPNFGACLPHTINVKPDSAIVGVGDSVLYSSVAKTSPEQCFGQSLDPYSFDWAWQITPIIPPPPIVADFRTPLRDACGNGVVEQGEDCDDGNIESSDGCSGLDPAGWLPGISGACLEEGDLDTGNTNYNIDVCGNGALEVSEQCERPSSQGCSFNCTLSGSVPGVSLCGDGIINVGEQCDDAELLSGNLATSGDGCSASCLVELSSNPTASFCRSNANLRFDFTQGECGACDAGFTCFQLSGAGGNTNTGPVCGNGVIEVGEECDFGGVCSDNLADCTVGNRFSCSDPFTATCEVQPVGSCSDNGARCTSANLLNCNNPGSATCDDVAPSINGCSVECINAGSVQEAIDPPNVGPFQIVDALANGFTTIQSWIASFSPPAGPLGSGDLQVGDGIPPDGDPIIIERFPNCGTACANALLGAIFNVTMDTSTLDASNIFLYECGADSSCDISTLTEIIGLDFAFVSEFNPNDRVNISLPFSYNRIDFDQDGVVDGPTLLPNTYYRVVVNSRVKSASPIRNLIGLNFEDPNDPAPGLDSHSWVFKTQSSSAACTVGRVEVHPQSLTLPEGTLQTYFAEPWTQSGSCDPLFGSDIGQRLNPYFYDWRWDTFEIDGIDVADFLIPLRDGCGNSIVEYGEDCDDGNLLPGDGCSVLCQHEGSNGFTSICGNNIIETGEDCDDGNEASDDGCSGLDSADWLPGILGACLWEGNTNYEVSVCGNGIVEAGEQCDTGSEPNGRDDDGCTDICTFSGALPSTGSICGDGQVTKGESCDQGELASGDPIISNDGCTGADDFSGGPPCSSPALANQATCEHPANARWCYWTGSSCASRQCLTENPVILGVEFNMALSPNTVDRLDSQGGFIENHLTIQACATAIRAGQTCLVGDGTYLERISFQSINSGTAADRITFRTQNLGKVEMWGFDTEYANYLTIDGFNITVPTSLALSGGTNKYGVFVSSDYVDVINNHIYDVDSMGIRTQWAYFTIGTRIMNNKLERIGHGINVNCNDCLIEGNDLSRLTRSPEPSLSIDADYIRFTGNNIVIRNNYLHDTIMCDICNAEYDCATLGYSSTECSHMDCFQVFDNNEVIFDVIIENNICTGYYGQGMIAEIASSDPQSGNWLIRNNVFTGGDAIGLNIYGVQDVKIINNVIKTDGALGVRISDSKSNKTFSYNSSGTIYNNIFYDTNGIKIQGSSVVSIDKNMHNTVNNLPPTDIGNTDPLLVNPNNFIGPDGIPWTSDDGYRLQSGSPAIDVGTDVSVYGITEDAFGTSRPQGSGFDIGAHEFISSTPGVCDLTSGSWSTISATEGDIVTLNIIASNCSGESFVYTIYENDGIFPDDLINSFTSNSLNPSWTTIYVQDQSGGPEYYFVVTVANNPTETIQSSGGDLSVTLLSQPPQPQCSDEIDTGCIDANDNDEASCSDSDFDNDGDVDGSDLQTLQNSFGREGCGLDNNWCDGTDLNLDTFVTILDFSIFLGCFEANGNDEAGLPLYATFDGATTNFSLEIDIANVTDVVLERAGLGRILFGSEPIDFRNKNLNAYVYIANNLIGINDVELPALASEKATLVLYNLSFTNPSLYEDGVPCTHCQILSYLGGDLTFTVDHFSNFSAAELVSPSNPLIVGNSNWDLAVCGNGQVEYGEECDNGTEPDGISTDGCTDSCLFAGSVYADFKIDPYQIVLTTAIGSPVDEVNEEIRAWHNLAPSIVGVGELKVVSGGLVKFAVIGHNPPVGDPSLQCLNVEISATFSRELDVDTINDNFVLCYGVGCTGPNLITEYSYRTIRGSCVNNKCQFAGADDLNSNFGFCSTSADCVGSKIIVTGLDTPNGFLARSTTTNILLSQTDLLDTKGDSLTGCSTVGTECSWDFQTSNNFCNCDYVGVSINPTSGGADTVVDYFTCAGDDCGSNTPLDPRDDDALKPTPPELPGNQHEYYATCYDINNPTDSRIALSTTGIYFTYSQLDPDDIIEDFPAIPSIGSLEVVTANNQNGKADVRVVATEHTCADTGQFCDPSLGDCLSGAACQPDIAAIQTVTVTSFICNNPWPDLTAFPYIDNESNSINPDTNFTMYYCRDAGGPGVDDDLPALGAELVSSIAGSSSIKDFLFPIPATGDAIGIKILKNPLHLSPATWYRSGLCSDAGVPDFDDLCFSNSDCSEEATCVLNIFDQGSFSQGIVDGYEAIREGRTAYVGATNLASDDLFSNIYLISYSDDASASTVEIFNRILDKNQIEGVWSFNNTPEFTNHRFCLSSGFYTGTTIPCTTVGVADTSTCSALSLQSQAACEAQANSGCTWEGSLNACLALMCEPILCTNDFECPNLVCSADKEMVVRDAKRFGDLRNIQILLENYFNENSIFPLLSAGTYVPSTTFSVWPSWQQTLGDDLGTQIFEDPLNRFVGCPGFTCDADGNGTIDSGETTVCDAAVDTISCPAPGACLPVDADQARTCWDEVNLQLACPEDGYVYAYRAAGGGLEYQLYSRFEYEGAGNWRTAAPPSLYDFPLSNLAAGSCQILNLEIGAATISGGTTPSNCWPNLFCYGGLITDGTETCNNVSECVALGYGSSAKCTGDADGDGVCDFGVTDNCSPQGLTNCSDFPNFANCFNPDQADANLDGIGDVCDPVCKDDDKDLVCDNIDICPTVWNPLQLDIDGDGIGDSCDQCTDVDGDGFGSPGDVTCPNGPFLDCKDLIFAINPFAIEQCTDGIDNNCDGLIDTADVIACPADTCFDTDGGPADYENFGIVTGENGGISFNNSDFCTSPTNINEFGCDGTTMVQVSIDCEAVFGLNWTCAGNKCVPPIAPGDTCSDSDGGGPTQSQIEGRVTGIEGGIAYNNPDSCAGGVLTEWSCSGSSKFSTPVDCSAIGPGWTCEAIGSEHKCVPPPPPPPSCSDPDGSNTTIQSTVTGDDGSGGTFSFTDSCSADILTEQLCSGTFPTSTTVDCAASGLVCVGGKCEPPGDSCSDSDGGPLDYKNEGEVSGVESGTPYAIIDSCSGGGSGSVTLELGTNEAASCGYSTSIGTAFSAMTPFTSTGGTAHTTEVSGLTNGSTYFYYIKCQDTSGNITLGDHELSFSIDAPVDLTPPNLLKLAPHGEIPALNDGDLSLFTLSGRSHCKFSDVSGTSYAGMTDFTITNSTGHINDFPPFVIPAGFNTFYVLCKDTMFTLPGNINTVEHVIRFNKGGTYDPPPQIVFIAPNGNLPPFAAAPGSLLTEWGCSGSAKISSVIDCEAEIGIGWSCLGNECVPPPDSCTELDDAGPFDYGNQGKVEGFKGGVAYSILDSCSTGIDLVERICAGDQADTKSIDCVAEFSIGWTCLAGKCEPPGDTCDDSDGGGPTQSQLEGRVTGIEGGIAFDDPDLCNTLTELNEWSCSGTSKFSTPVDCSAIGPGWTCEVLGSEHKCIPPPDSCTELDDAGPFDYKNQGKVEGFKSGVAYSIFDSCSTGIDLVERICTVDQADTKLINCVTEFGLAFECSAGECILGDESGLCFNGKDDDLDGFTDCADNDCWGEDDGSGFGAQVCCGGISDCNAGLINVYGSNHCAFPPTCDLGSNTCDPFIANNDACGIGVDACGLCNPTSLTCGVDAGACIGNCDNECQLDGVNNNNYQCGADQNKCALVCSECSGSAGVYNCTNIFGGPDTEGPGPGSLCDQAGFSCSTSVPNSCVACNDADKDGFCDDDDICPYDPDNDFDNDGFCAVGCTVGTCPANVAVCLPTNGFICDGTPDPAEVAYDNCAGGDNQINTGICNTSTSICSNGGSCPGGNNAECTRYSVGSCTAANTCIVLFGADERLNVYLNGIMVAGNLYLPDGFVVNGELVGGNGTDTYPDITKKLFVNISRPEFLGESVIALESYSATSFENQIRGGFINSAETGWCDLLNNSQQWTANSVLVDSSFPAWCYIDDDTRNTGIPPAPQGLNNWNDPGFDPLAAGWLGESSGFSNPGGPVNNLWSIGPSWLTARTEAVWGWDYGSAFIYSHSYCRSNTFIQP